MFLSLGVGTRGKNPNPSLSLGFGLKLLREYLIWTLISGEPSTHITATVYRDKIYQCMTSTQELVGIHNDATRKSWSKYATDIKVGKV